MTIDELCHAWFDSEARNLNEVLYLIDKKQFEEDWDYEQDATWNNDPDDIEGLWS